MTRANFTTFFRATPPRETVPEEVRLVPELTDEDVKALKYMGSSGEFTLQKTASMYAGVTRLRPGPAAK